MSEEWRRGEVSEHRISNPNWQDVLSSHKEEYAAVAREGYIQSGRGLVVVYLHQAIYADAQAEWTIPIAYIAEPEISEPKRWPNGQVPPLIEQYEPRTEFVAMVIEPGGLTHFARFQAGTLKKYARAKMV
jgi:hypothetical protein